MRSYVRLAILCTTLMLAACGKDESTGSIPQTNNNVVATSLLNVAYGTDAAQKMDIYLPANRNTASTKTIVLIHGGAWSSGDKADFNSFVDTLKRRLPTYAIANINYRLAAAPATNTFPTQEQDVKAAFDFIASKSNEFIISNKTVALGASAGAHLALLQSYKYNSNNNIKAVVDLFGPTDMTAMYNDPASPLAPSSSIALLLNGTPASNATLYNSSSPINFVTSSTIPTIIFHGGSSDFLVKTSQSTALRDKLVQNNITVQYTIYPNEGHGWTGSNLIDTFNKIESFLTQYVQ
ncbi:prolyl oligopeptidase family serine peptidase [Ferruginibacter yonginensis]|uniref:Prolyl oligopeptidase family serine peptidase n=1 Tax=Ferruginibacter yonginensis TaxID=1310416 RepID=A0ABV8QUY0_9BACT